MIDAISAGLFALLTPQALLFLSLGVVYGLVIGILPGLGGVVAMALLLPFTYGFETAATLALLLGAHIATIWGDSVTSILFSVPGSAKGLSLCFDGYPMTKQGKAKRALRGVGDRRFARRHHRRGVSCPVHTADPSGDPGSGSQ